MSASSIISILQRRENLFERETPDKISNDCEWCMASACSVEKTPAEQIASLKKILHSKEQLLSILAHDFRSPLAGMLTMLRILKKRFHHHVSESATHELKEKLSESGMEQDFQKLTAAGERLLSLIDELMSLERVKYDKHFLRFINISELVSDCCTILSIPADEKKITLMNHIDTPLTVHGDREMLRQVILNLIQNAIRYSACGGSVSMSYEITDRITLTFTNSTCIRPCRLRGVRFDQSDVAQSEPPKSGTGFGLLFAFEIMQAHQGELDYTTSENEGTSFYLHFPIVKPSLAVYESPAKNSIPPVLEQHELNSICTRDMASFMTLLESHKVHAALCRMDTLTSQEIFEFLYRFENIITIKQIPCLVILPDTDEEKLKDGSRSQTSLLTFCNISEEREMINKFIKKFFV